MERKPVSASKVDSLYGEETAEFRAWVADYIARNKEMLAIMACL